MTLFIGEQKTIAQDFEGLNGSVISGIFLLAFETLSRKGYIKTPTKVKVSS